ncbi:MAG: hypothetical protein Q8O42_15280 [Acidobacteriota bacterium]|nr:hypothetical protein [Acidobacteriota bacterium]
MDSTVDAEVLTLSLRTRLMETKNESLEGRVWPCCLQRTACPHGGAAQSINALGHWAAAVSSQPQACTSLQVGLLLAVPVHYYSFHQSQESRRNPRTIRAAARKLFRTFFPVPSSSR